MRRPKRNFPSPRRLSRSKLAAINASTCAYADLSPAEYYSDIALDSRTTTASNLKKLERSGPRPWPRAPQPPCISRTSRFPNSLLDSTQLSPPPPPPFPSSSLCEPNICYLWTALPFRLRLMLFVGGFMVVYYTIFAKHHYYDNEMFAIHEEVEKLVKNASESGFLHQRFEEAELPAIFRDWNSGSDSTNATTATTSSNSSSKPSSKSLSRAIKSKSNDTVDVKDLPLKRKKRNKRKGRKKRKGRSEATSEKPVIAYDDAKGDSDSEINGNKTTTSMPHQNVSGFSTIPKLETDSSLSDSKAGFDISRLEDLKISNVPKGMVPVLSWNYDLVNNPNTTEQIFGLGNKFDHVAAYKPLCIDVNTNEGIMFEGETKCGGFNRSTGWLRSYCGTMRKSLYKEYLLHLQSTKRNRDWLEENKKDIQWVEGVTVLQILEKNCGNIAHFAGRLLLLHHILENINAYVSSPAKIDNVLILPSFHIMKRFLYPHNYGFWHETMLKALVAPSKVAIGTLGNFLYRSSKAQDQSEPLIQLLHNFSVVGSEAPETKYVCFRKAVVPGYLKARFFVNDMEYPSIRPSLQSSIEGAPPLPRDSLRMRERVAALLKQTPVIKKMKREIILVDRDGSRRVFDSDSRPKVIDMLRKTAKDNKYNFKIVNFEKKPFPDQYDLMTNAAITIGIHGANLVNTMFMPPLSVLIEVFPFGFSHEMYVNGGNSGIKYFAYEMKTGRSFDGLSRFRSTHQCIKHNKNCKVHYRDSQLRATNDDLTGMTEVLESAIKWCNDLGISEPLVTESKDSVG